MDCRLRLLINRLCKSVTKAPNSYVRSLQQNSIIARRLSYGIVTGKKICESNLAYADLFADCKSIQSTNEFSTQIKPELLHSNLKSLSSRRCNKLTEDSDKKCCNVCQLTHKFSFLQNPSEKYRLSYLQENDGHIRDEVETDLFDVQHILDPWYEIKSSQDVINDNKLTQINLVVNNSIKLYDT